ncbi:MAG: hypothetical protein AAGK21_10615 [Bacteroidota bacterium]
MHRLFAFALVLAACASPESPDAGEEGVAVEASGVQFDASDTDRPCDLLTAEMASEVLGVPAGDLDQSDLSQLSNCSYETPAGATVAIAGIDVYETAEDAAASFDALYREVTEEEAAEAAEAIRDQIAVQEAEGELDAVTAYDAEAMAGGLTSIMTQTEYEDIDGIGDQARYDGTESTMMDIRTVESTLHVLVGNAILSVRGDTFTSDDYDERLAGPDAETVARTRETTMQAARAVVAGL